MRKGNFTFRKIPLHAITAFLSLLFLLLPRPAHSYGISVTTDKVQYKSGDDVIVKIKNEMKEPIYFLGMCSLKDCMKQDDQWSCEDDKCDAPQDVLVSGEEKELRIRVIGLVVGDMKYKFDYRTAILEKDYSTYSNEFFIINTGRPSPRLVNKQVNKKPVEKETIQSRIVDVGNEENKIENRFVAKTHEERIEAKEKVKSYITKNQKPEASKAKSYGMKNNEVVLAVSGIKKKDLNGLAGDIKKELSAVHSIEKIGAQKGAVQYFITLQGSSAADFSEQLKQAEFKKYRITPVQSTPNYIDCTLNYH